MSCILDSIGRIDRSMSLPMPQNDSVFHVVDDISGWNCPVSDYIRVNIRHNIDDVSELHYRSMTTGYSGFNRVTGTSDDCDNLNRFYQIVICEKHFGVEKTPISKNN